MDYKVREEREILVEQAVPWYTKLIMSHMYVAITHHLGGPWVAEHVVSQSEGVVQVMKRATSA